MIVFSPRSQTWLTLLSRTIGIREVNLEHPEATSGEIWRPVCGSVATNRLRARRLWLTLPAMTRRAFNRLSLAVMAASVLLYLASFLAGLDWNRFGSFGITADLDSTLGSYLPFVLPPATLLLYLVLRRVLFGKSTDG